MKVNKTYDFFLLLPFETTSPKKAILIKISKAIQISSESLAYLVALGS
jgi:hypothetical protein